MTDKDKIFVKTVNYSDQYGVDKTKLNPYIGWDKSLENNDSREIAQMHGRYLPLWSKFVVMKRHCVNFVA